MHRLVVFLSVLALLAGCGLLTPGSSALSGEWGLLDGTVDGAPIPLVEGTEITLRFGEDDRLGGTAACNSYSGELVRRDGGIRITALSQTEMACRDDIMAAEAAYLAAVSRVSSSSRDGDSLVLRGDGVELRFAALTAPADASLTGTSWLLDSVVSGDTVAHRDGPEARLRLDDDGSLSGSTGCRSFSARYTLDGREVMVRDVATDGECSGDLSEWDAAILGVLDGSFSAQIDGGLLTLTGRDGRGLVYRSE